MSRNVQGVYCLGENIGNENGAVDGVEANPGVIRGPNGEGAGSQPGVCCIRKSPGVSNGLFPSIADAAAAAPAAAAAAATGAAWLPAVAPEEDDDVPEAVDVEDAAPPVL